MVQTTTLLRWMVKAIVVRKSDGFKALPVRFRPSAPRKIGGYMLFTGTLIRGKYRNMENGVFLKPEEISAESIGHSKQMIADNLKIPVELLKFTVLPFSWQEYTYLQ